jgi:hypothetical protein
MPAPAPRWPLLTIIAAPGATAGLFFGALAGTPVQLMAGVVVLLLCVPVCAHLLRGAEFDPMEPLWPFLTCFAITFALKPLIDEAGGLTYEWFDFVIPQVVGVMVVACLALLLIYVGYYSPAYRLLLPLLPAPVADPCAARARLVSVLLALGAVIGTVFVARAVGPTFSFESAARGAYRIPATGAAYGRGYLIVFWTLSALAPAAQLAILLKTRRTSDLFLWVGITAAVFSSLLVLYSRQLMLQAIVTMLVVAYFRGRFIRGGTVVVLGLAILFAGGYLGLRTRSGSLSAVGAFAFLGHTFDSFEFMGESFDRISPAGHFAGLTYAEDAVLTFLPRAFFPEKPDVFGVVRIQNLVAPVYTTLPVYRATYPPGFLVEGYANFGVAGIIMISLIYGAALRLAREWFWRRRDLLFPMLIYGGMVLNMTAIFRSAGQTAMQTVVYGAVLYLLLHAQLPMRPVLNGPLR